MKVAFTEAGREKKHLGVVSSVQGSRVYIAYEHALDDVAEDKLPGQYQWLVKKTRPQVSAEETKRLNRLRRSGPRGDSDKLLVGGHLNIAT